LPETEHTHVPLAVILIQALHKWKHAHEGVGPKTQAEKAEFIASVKAMNKFGSKSMNFIEAVQSVLDCYKSDALPSNL
jgi:amyloid beta precursor protein binding protein 1